MAEAKKKAPARPAPTRGKKGQKLAVELVATDIPDVYVEYVQPPELEMTEEDEKNPIYKELRETYARFASREDGYAATYVKPSDAPTERSAEAAEEEGGAGAKKEEKTEHDDRDDREDTKPGPGGAEDNDDEDDDDEEEEGAMSNKQKKLLARMKVAELKTHCSKPEVVEVWDTTAADPRLLVYLKAYRNTIPVPSHWCQKRKYLQGKRGLEKPPWQLPSFIEATGIQKLRDAYAEKEDTKKLKQKGKDAKTAKLGKIDIDYQVLHDAFFKFQTKPKMTKVGELYYEGKEYEMDLKGKKPGTLTEETREALGMTDDGPPPWLINMQRYGPPPSYPSLKIPGLSAPIPPGAQFGYHPGGWGKPPVDEYGTPIYGDVFGVAASREHEDMTPYDTVVDKTLRWGKLDELSESESESEDEEDEDESDGEGLGDDDVSAGIQSMSSIQTGVETPEVPLDLRKRSGPVGGAEPQLYQVLASKETSVGEGNLMGSAHAYVVPGAAAAAAAAAGDVAGAVPGSKREAKLAAAGGIPDGTAIALNPEDLERGVDDATVAARYAAEREAERAAAAPEDFSDMVAENARARKRKAEAKKKESDAKKFKF